MSNAVNDRLNSERAVMLYANAMYDAIKESGDKGMPSGHLYAFMMQYVSLNVYEQILSVLKKIGKVTEENYLLKAV